MPHDIIDNQESKLADHVGLLLDNAERAKFAVGYFFRLRGVKFRSSQIRRLDVKN